jgi:hypothetical protein
VSLLSAIFQVLIFLSLPDHVHGLITADGPPRRVETEEAETGIYSAFYESVILLDDIIEIFASA